MTSRSVFGGTLIALVACLAGGGFYATRSVKQAKYDPATLCPAEGSQRLTLIIVDRTDPLTALEQSRVRDIVKKERDGALRGDRISIKLLKRREGSNDVTLDTIVDLCNPGAEANPIFENPKRVAARYRSSFIEPIDEALSSVAAQGSAPSSPIARAIQSAMEGVSETVGKRLKLILISDLMEHSANMSAYNGTFSEAALRKLMPQGTQAQLRGADVEILVLPRPQYRANQDAAVAVWRQYFRDIAGRAPAITQL